MDPQVATLTGTDGNGSIEHGPLGFHVLNHPQDEWVTFQSVMLGISAPWSLILPTNQPARHPTPMSIKVGGGPTGWWLHTITLGEPSRAPWLQVLPTSSLPRPGSRKGPPGSLMWVRGSITDAVLMHHSQSGSSPRTNLLSETLPGANAWVIINMFQ